MVLDASALLAFLFQEEGSRAVAAALEGSCMSAVNLSEVLGLFARDGKDTHIVAGWLRQLPVEIVPFDRQQAAESAALRLQTDRHGLSSGDRACLSLGLERGIPVLTADKAWKKIRLPLEVHLIR
jgi:PIN domain nuclease of toxin-antitoxin system